MKSSSPGPVRRVQFNASVRMMNIIDKIAELTDAVTDACVIRRAIEVYSHLLGVYQEDGEIVLLRKGEIRERMVFVEIPEKSKPVLDISRHLKIPPAQPTRSPKP